MNFLPILIAFGALIWALQAPIAVLNGLPM